MTPPSKFSCLAVSVMVALVGWFAVGVFTQPRYEPPPERTIEGLVLDGSGVTTTAPVSSAGRPVERIPRREVNEEDEDG